MKTRTILEVVFDILSTLNTKSLDTVESCIYSMDTDLGTVSIRLFDMIVWDDSDEDLPYVDGEGVDEEALLKLILSRSRAQAALICQVVHAIEDDSGEQPQCASPQPN